MAAVEVSTDGGTTWNPATGTDKLDLHVQRDRANQSLFRPAPIDDAVNIGSADSVNFTAEAQTCPCSIFGSAVTGSEENDNCRRRARA